MNQYQSITTAPNRTVVGRAPVADAVSVNGTTLGPAHRTGDVFHFALPAAANANSPVLQPATVVSGGNTIERAFYHPKAVTAPQHDLDGNLVNDGRWVYLWDAENRLIQMESTVAAVQAGAPYRKLVFHYDAGGRRLARTVYHGTAAAPVFHSSTRWLYDGWNPISEFSGTADTGGTITRTKSYTWGLDLSGTSQGAGGVGGLLAVIVHSGFTNSAYYPSYDGNGNIVAWTLEGTPAPVSRLEYDAFGNTLVEQGVVPSAYGFSTKMQDGETGLFYYGYRYYDSVKGRWPSRDPIEEHGGLNLYGFVRNNGFRFSDYLGLNEVIVSGGCNVLNGGYDYPGATANPELGDKIVRKLVPAAGHDVQWRNFILAAEAEILRRKKNLKEGEVIEWHVEKSSYALRAHNDKKPQDEYINEITNAAKRHGVKLKWFSTKMEFVKNINFEPGWAERGDKAKIQRIVFYSHGFPGQINLNYTGKPQIVGDEYDMTLTSADIKKGLLYRSAFTDHAIGISCACRTAAKAENGESLRDVWKDYFGFEFYGSPTRTSYHDPKNPQPSEGGAWVPSPPAP